MSGFWRKNCAEKIPKILARTSGELEADCHKTENVPLHSSSRTVLIYLKISKGAEQLFELKRNRISTIEKSHMKLTRVKQQKWQKQVSLKNATQNIHLQLEQSLLEAKVGTIEFSVFSCVPLSESLFSVVRLPGELSQEEEEKPLAFYTITFFSLFAFFVSFPTQKILRPRRLRAQF